MYAIRSYYGKIIEVKIEERPWAHMLKMTIVVIIIKFLKDLVLVEKVDA